MHIDGLEVQYRRKLIPAGNWKMTTGKPEKSVTQIFHFLAVPSIRNPEESNPSQRSGRKVLIDIKQELNQMKKQASAVKPAPAYDGLQLSEQQHDHSPQDSVPEMEMNIKPSNENSADSLNSEALIQALRKEVSENHRMLQEARNRIIELETANKDLQVVHQEQVLLKAESILSERYTKNQIDIMLGRKKKVQQWTADELSMGFTLNYLSKPALKFINKTCNFPLPSAKCLQDYAARIDMRKGFFYDVFRILKAYAATLSERDRICVIIYDEMSVSEVYEYDRRNDDVLKPATKMQVVFS